MALLSAAAPTAGSAASSKPAGPEKPAESVPGEVLVRFDPGTGARVRDRIRDGADVRLERRLLLPRAELVHTRPGQNIQEAITELESRPDVTYAEPNFIHRIQPTTPNDPLYSSLWGLNNTGQSVNGTSGTADADIDAPEVWDTQTGSAGVIVAVLDTGLAYDRPDIAPHVWINPGEIPGNGLDDGDPNTLIDDVNGWDFVYDDKDPRDGNDHGTHVAGTIGAVGNNAAGVVGVNWTVTIMPVQVCTHVGSCPVSDQIDGINYAGTMGADVVNMSLGGPGHSQAQEDAISNAGTTLFAVAAGNEATNNDTTPSYPCSYDDPANLICVAASTQSDGLASFSNFGATSVDLAAPGTNIRSTLPAYDTVFLDDFEGVNSWDWDAAPASTNWERTTEVTAPSATQSVTDSEGANYGNNDDATMTLAATSPINLTGRTGCTLQYRLRLRTADASDLLRVYASTNQAGPYTTVIDQRTGDLGTSSFFFAEGDLEAFEGQGALFLRFRLTSNGSGTDEGAHVDDVKVQCAAVPDPGTAFAFFNGTSMATPHVAGAAALLLAEDPTATVAELRSALLNSVDLKAAFTGKMVTEGRLNVNRALATLVDVQDPDPFTVVSPTDGATVNTRTPLFSWNAATDNMGIAEYELYVDGVLRGGDIHPGATSAPPASPLPEGTFPWFVRAIDFAGNDTDSNTHNVTVDVDETPPSFPGLVGPANGTTVTTASLTFTWNPSTDSESGVSKYQLLIDGAVSRDGLGASTTSATPGGPLAEGTHTWLIRVFDGAGNSADSVQRTLTVDLPGVHSRSVTLALKKHLKAKGKVTVADGFAACVQSVAVVVERKGHNGWKNLKTIVTDAAGAFSTTLSDREGKYRGRVPPASVGADTCAAATSPSRRHRHV